MSILSAVFGRKKKKNNNKPNERTLNVLRKRAENAINEVNIANVQSAINRALINAGPNSYLTPAGMLILKQQLRKGIRIINNPKFRKNYIVTPKIYGRR